MQIVWDTWEDRPASGREIDELVQRGWLVINFYLLDPVDGEPCGAIWVDLTPDHTQRDADRWDLRE